MPSTLRSLPSISWLLNTAQVQDWIHIYGRNLTLDAIRNVLDGVRSTHSTMGGITSEEVLLVQTGMILEEWTRPALRSVINASGVILHTNLGRAPLSKASIQAIQDVALSYSNLEYDLNQGKRGSRLDHAEELIKKITGAEAAIVVNNNAAAVLLVLTALARRKSVVIARSQLVEVGGGFRIPDVMKQSGAKLVEIGTTNRIHLNDYEKALEEKPGVIMHAHRSNFRIIGFTEEPTLAEIAEVSHRAGIPFIDDQGSGVLLNTEKFGLAHEPTVQESLAAGSDLVCFSGDKLLGGPQAGIIAGRANLIAKLRKHPLTRAFRADKLCLAGLSATLLHYIKDETEREIPIWRMISETTEKIEERAHKWRAEIGCGEVRAGESTVGGGSLPGENFPTYLFALKVEHPTRFLEGLRRCTPAVIARTVDNLVVFDPRTVLPEQDNYLLNNIKRLL